MKNSRENVVGVVLLTLVCAASACDSKEREPNVAAPSASAAAASAAVLAAQAGHRLPPYVGRFEGKYDAKLFRIEMTAAQGAVKQWAEDDGQSLSGSGTLVLDIAEDRRIVGTSAGPLGTLRASGLFEDGTVRVAFLPDSAAVADQVGGATLVGKLEGNKLEGTLQAATGDSLRARTATVELEKKAGVQSAASSGDPSGGK